MYSPNEAKEVELSPIGNISGNCRTLELEGGLDGIKASMSTYDYISSVVYLKGDKKVSYGPIDTYTSWTFSDSDPLIGLYGR